MSRAVALETSRGWRIAKEKQSHKIDVVVALAQAALGAVRDQLSEPSILVFYRRMAEREKRGEPAISATESNALVDRYEQIRKTYSPDGGDSDGDAYLNGRFRFANRFQFAGRRIR